MRLLWQRLKLLVEPSSAIVLAALLQHRERFAGQRVGLLLSGGNVDLDALLRTSRLSRSTSLSLDTPGVGGGGGGSSLFHMSRTISQLAVGALRSRLQPLAVVDFLLSLSSTM
jgi:hypothetical protein